MRRAILLALPALLLTPAPARALAAAAATRGAATGPGNAAVAGGAAALNAVRGTTGLSTQFLGGLLNPTFTNLLLPQIDPSPTLSSVFAAAERFKARVLANVVKVFNSDQYAADYVPSPEILQAARDVNSHKKARREAAPAGAGRGEGFDSFREAQAAEGSAAAAVRGKPKNAREQAVVIERRLDGIEQGGSPEDRLRISGASFDGSAT